jgi:AraC family transcriptional regulator
MVAGMLRYLAAGQRKFGLYPMAVNARSNWEFYAVVQGMVGPTIKGLDELPMRSRYLWLFPPGCQHGWRGVGDQPARIVAFHFGTVPAPLDRIVREAGFHGVPLEAADARAITSLEAKLREHYHQPNSFSNIHFDHALHHLSILISRNLSPQVLETPKAAVQRKVDTALTWYSEHLAQRPKIRETAAAVHVSTSHLRRLFWQVNQESPQTAFSRLKMQRVMHLLTESDMKLEALALSCGFSSASDFCRAFKQHHKISPDLWRRTFLKPYDEAAERAAAAAREPRPRRSQSKAA